MGNWNFDNSLVLLSVSLKLKAKLFGLFMKANLTANTHQFNFIG